MPKITEIRCGQFASSKIESTTQLSHGRVVIYHTDKNYHVEKKMITWLPHGTHVIVFKNLEQAGAISFSNFLCGNFFTRVIFDHIVRGIPEGSFEF